MQRIVFTLLLIFSFSLCLPAQTSDAVLIKNRAKPIAVKLNKGDIIKVSFVGQRKRIKGTFHGIDDNFLYLKFGYTYKSELKVDKASIKHIIFRTEKKTSIASFSLYGLSGISGVTGLIVMGSAIAYPPAFLYGFGLSVISAGFYIWAETFHKKRMSPLK